MSEAPNDKTTRGVVDILVYATARLLLVVAVSAAIFGVARLIGLTEFPVVVATLFGLIIAMPLGIWVFSPLRRRATAALAVAGERQRASGNGCGPGCVASRYPKNSERGAPGSRHCAQVGWAFSTVFALIVAIRLGRDWRLLTLAAPGVGCGKVCDV